MTNEYPIDDEFWKWWNAYFANEKIDISLDLCYNNYVKENRKENPEYGTVEFHECPPRLEDSTRG